ncbi:MAG: glycosyltransferase [Hyphomonadaceae bacterium]|nr:glycosyltransferase [Hyphomonadaceae bacterium]
MSTGKPGASATSSIVSSTLRQIFDADYYGRQAAKRSLVIDDPLQHFLSVGWRLGLNPCALFDVAYYRAQNPDASSSALNPLLHYIIFGARRGAIFSPWFDVPWYVAQHPEAALDPLSHYLTIGVVNGYAPHPTIDPRSEMGGNRPQPTGSPASYSESSRGAAKAAGSPEALRPTDQKRTKQFELRQATPTNPRNPFFRLIGDRLHEHSDFSVEYTTNWDNLRQGSRVPVIVHLHQLDPFYHKGAQTVTATRARADRLLTELQSIKKAGHRIVITKHNPIPHTRHFLDLDREIESQAIKLADCVIVLAEAARHAVLNDHPAANVRFIPHPAFSAPSPLPSKTVARRMLGLSPERRILGTLGELKEYKGLEFIIEAASLVQDADFVIVGFASSPNYVEQLSRRLPSNVKLFPYDVPETDVGSWLAAFDLSVFGFKDIWVSGSVLLSISHQTPVLAPHIGFLHEYVSDDNTGFLYDPGDLGSFRRELMRFFGSPYQSHYRYMCDAWATSHSPSAIARNYETLYLQLLEAA